VHAATWAEAGLLTAARLTDSRTTAYEPVAELVEQALSWLEEAGLTWHPQVRPRVRADIGHCSKSIAEQIVAAGADFAIGVQRQPKIWWFLGQIDEAAWAPALDMDRAEITVTDYPYCGWPRHPADHPPGPPRRRDDQRRPSGPAPPPRRRPPPSSTGTATTTSKSASNRPSTARHLATYPPATRASTGPGCTPHSSRPRSPVG